MDAASGETAYDQVPYPSSANTRAQPDYLATLATFFGMTPAPVPACRVLEIGCSNGGNLLPMAHALPEARFVGLDASARQIDAGQAVVDELGMKNVRLRHMDIMDVGPDFGEFDYILSHGVYSWIPDPVREKLLAICGDHLAPNGVAYVSYNTYPGWHERGLVRDLMLYHTRDVADPRERIRRARAVLDLLVDAVPEQNSSYAAALRREQQVLRESSDSYVFHDLLEESNDPVYFHHFAGRLAAHGLHYLAEAEFWTTQAGVLPEGAAAVIRQLGTTLIEREQYLDFWRNRRFRQTLICRAGVALDRQPQQHVDLARFLVASPLTPKTGDDSQGQATFAGPRGGTLTTDHRAVKAALRHLAEAWPAAVPFPALLAAARARADRDEPRTPATATSPDTDVEALRETLISCFSSGILDLHTYQPPFATTPGERPEASAFARFEAARGPRVTSLLHVPMQIDDPVALHLLRRLDGRHDRRALRDTLLDLARDGVLQLEDEGGRPITDRATLAPIIAGAVEHHLARLARFALLVG